MKKSIFTFVAFMLVVYLANAQWEQTSYSGAPVLNFTSTGTGIYAETYGDGIMLSANNGDSWLTLNNGLTDPFVTTIAVNGSNMYAGTWHEGIFLSTNNGSNWSCVISHFPTSLGNGVTAVEIVLNGNDIYAATNTGMFVSTDNGTTWTGINTGITSGLTCLAIDNGVMYAGSQSEGVFVSSNNGSSWTAMNNGLTDSTIYDLVISGQNIFVSTGMSGVFVSSNNGSSWTAVNTSLPIFQYLPICLVASGDSVFAGTQGAGVFVLTDNGSSWTAVNTGLLNDTVYSLGIHGDTLFAGCRENGVGNVWRTSVSRVIPGCDATFTIIPDSTVLHHYFAINFASGVQPLTYFWSWGDGTFDTVAYPSHTYSVAGYYNVCLTITDADGCNSSFCNSTYNFQKSENSISSIDVISYEALGIDNIQGSGLIEIYPNPALDIVNIVTPGIAVIEVLNINGQLVKTVSNHNNASTINVADLSKGIYLIRVQTEHAVVTRKFIKE